MHRKPALTFSGALTTGERDVRDHCDALYRSEVPAPSATHGFRENLPRVGDWLIGMTRRVHDFIGGLVAGEKVSLLPHRDVAHRAVVRYESHYLRLAEKAPEFAFWAELGEHAATRHRVGVLDADLRAALDVHGRALSRITALLALVPGRTDVGRHREGLHRANTGVLGKPIVPNDAERYDTDITFPTTERAFLTPHYRIAAHDREARPADENRWSEREVRQDLEAMLAAHLTSADATRAPMLVLGHPGAGKSILTKVLAARLPPGEYTVVRVPLRNVAAGAPIIDQVQQALDAATNNRVRWHEVTDDSADTVLVVLLDGLDELRQPLLLLMLALYAAYPGSPKLDAGRSTSALYEPPCPVRRTVAATAIVRWTTRCCSPCSPTRSGQPALDRRVRGGDLHISTGAGAAEHPARSGRTPPLVPEAAALHPVRRLPADAAGLRSAGGGVLGEPDHPGDLVRGPGHRSRPGRPVRRRPGGAGELAVHVVPVALRPRPRQLAGPAVLAQHRRDDLEADATGRAFRKSGGGRVLAGQDRRRPGARRTGPAWHGAGRQAHLPRTGLGLDRPHADLDRARPDVAAEGVDVVGRGPAREHLHRGPPGGG
ncbi:ATP-binding protein [Saccharothrix sp. BKS2]|uniref:NACHT N-terminal helical domain 7-containing protein n=1 Tax=Saccharothrix sp. BKS2 TaxID=3064400 RepID=UPI0039E92853